MTAMTNKTIIIPILNFLLLRKLSILFLLYSLGTMQTTIWCIVSPSVPNTPLVAVVFFLT